MEKCGAGISAGSNERSGVPPSFALGVLFVLEALATGA
jgi:hypothetical protein